MHVCNRARGDCKRNPACTVYGDGNNTASLRINMLARLNDTDFCGVYINDVSFLPLPAKELDPVFHLYHYQFPIYDIDRHQLFFSILS